MIKIALNGFGRIGRIFFRQAFGHPDLEFVAVNDLGSSENLAYLLKYDSIYGPYEQEVAVSGDNLTVGGKSIKILHESEPAKLPWEELDIDIVVEATGVFESHEKSERK